MASKRKKTYIVGIAVAFLLPLFSFLIFRQVSKGKIKLPVHYGISFIDTLRSNDGTLRYDTVYNEVGDLTLWNQLGKKRSLNRDLRGKILVINFFDARDAVVSPIIAGNLHSLERRFQSKASEKPTQDNIGSLFQLISISVNPLKDQVPQIRAYADKYKANSDHWWLMTGDSASIYNYALNQLNLPLMKNGKMNPAVLNQIILVDTLRHIRGYFNGLDSFQLSNLADDISIISMEKNKQ